MVGEIYLAKIYFTDLSSYKIRPVLIIKDLGDDCICLQLSSKIKQNRIAIRNNNLSDGSFKKDTVVVVPKNFTLHKKIFVKYIGKIEKSLQDKIFSEFCKKIGCDR
ncbi:MAG: type II toxin-antitoxin system PemK/MazF family toxin [Campylobacterota bacterium]